MNAAQVKFILTLIGMSVATVFYTFTTFETKENIRENIIYRLDRIESKLDRVIQDR